MGSIPGPVIKFRIDGPALSGAVKPAMDQVRAQAKSASDAVAEDWRVAAAKIRASMVTGISDNKEILSSRQQLVSVLNSEIEGLRVRDQLTKSQLSNLKAMTLEIERQASHLKGTGGLTSGTASALNQVSLQTTLGFERILDSLVNRYLGGAAGAATRLARDVTYYGAQAGAVSGTGVAGGIGATFESLAEKVSPATIALTGMLGTLTAIAAIGGSVTISLAKQNEEFENLANVTGLSSRQVQIFTELAKEQGLEVNGIVTSIARFQAELGEYVRKGEGANAETIRFVAAAKQLGIAVTDSEGHLRPVTELLIDLSDALKAIPPGSEQSAAGLDLLGIRGRALLPLLLSNKGALRDLIDEVSRSGPIIDEQMSAKLDTAKTAWDRISRSISTAALNTRELIASGFLSLFETPGVPQFNEQQGALINQALKLGSVPLRAGEGVFVGTAADNQALLRQAQSVAGNTPLQAELEAKRKELNAAIKDNQGAQALELAKQVHSLEEAVKNERTRTEEAKKLAEQVLKYREHLTNVITLGDKHVEQMKALRQTPTGSTGGVYGPFNAPISGPPEVATGDPGNILNFLGPTSLEKFSKASDLLKQINEENEELFKSQEDKAKEHYDEELESLKEALGQQLISRQEYADAVKKITADLNKTLFDSEKKFDSEAGSLFDTLLTGKGQAIQQKLRSTIEGIVLQPFKDYFERAVGGAFANLAKITDGLFKKGTGQGNTGTGTAGTGGGFPIDFGGVFGPNSPGGTPGWWRGSLGIGGTSGTTGGTISAGQVGALTQNMYVTAQQVYLTGTLGVPGSGGLGGPNAFGNFFGNLNPFGGAQALGGAGGIGGGVPGSAGGIGGTLSTLGSFIPGAALLGIGVGTGSAQATAIGAAMLAKAGIGGLLTYAANNPSSAIGSALSGSAGTALGAIGGALPGIGLGIAGGLKGGVGGTLEAGVGGALTGASFGALAGPAGALIGAAVGGAVGIIGGIISTIFGGSSYQNQINHAIKYNNYIAPPSETFSFAEGNSIAQTLSTGFSQSGNSVNTYGLGNTPFYASALTGKLGAKEIQDLRLEESGLLSNQPFLGQGIGPGVNPFLGQGPIGNRARSFPVQVHFNISAIDGQSVNDFLTKNGQSIAKIVSSQTGQTSSGFATNVRRAAFLP
ncbi:MAG: hypothetical protein WB780_21215 [Candidatus Acidiferrales bacterium]